MRTEMPQECVFRWVTGCELLYGQPEAYYRKYASDGTLAWLDLNHYHVLISGLDRQIYRSEFGIDAFDYTVHFRKVEGEICDALAELNVPCVTLMLLYDHTKRFVMLFSTPENVSAQQVAQLVADKINQLYDQIFDMSKTVYRNYTVLSDPISGYENLQAAFGTVRELAKQQYFDMRTLIVTPSLIAETTVPADDEQVHEDLLNMYTAIRSGDEQEALTIYHRLMSQLGKARDFRLLKDVLSSFHTSMTGILKSRGLDVEPEDRLAFRAASCPTFQLLVEQGREMLLGYLQRLNDTKPMSALIQEAVRYIRHHYAEELSVADVAAHIGMSESWLTKRFKQECDISPINFLLSVRVEKARELLAATDMHVFEIACAVGFENSGYFISVFRRMMGVTPKAYRSQMKAKS